MSVEVEKSEGILKHLSITVVAKEVDDLFESKLRETASKVRLDGFRAGKVPMALVRNRFGKQIRQEMLTGVIDTHLQKALDGQTFKVSGVKSVDLTQNEAGKDFIFKAIVETFPEIDIKDLDKISVEKIIASVEEVDLDDMIATLQKQHATWHGVDRAIEQGDRVKVDFVGTLEGVEFDGGSAQDFAVDIGSGQMIEGFETGLMGKKMGEQVQLDLVFPLEYGRQDLAGKPVKFAVTIKSIEAPTLPALDAEFSKKFNVETYEKLREEIKGNMMRELEFGLNNTLKTQVFENIASHNPIEVPSDLIHRETQSLKYQAAQRFGMQKNDEWKKLPDPLFAEQAKKRVALSLLISHLIDMLKLTVDDLKVKALIARIAESYEDALEAEHEIFEDENRLSNLQQAVLEDQLVEHLLKTAKVTEKPLSFKEAMKTIRGQNASV